MGAKILIVDDAAFMRMMLRDILTSKGHIIIGEAEDGVQSITMYNSLTPDLVVMDITMPVMDGIQAIKGIMTINPDARIIMCSAMGQQTKVIQSIQLGALDFIVKPFQPERVVEAVRKALLQHSYR